MKNLLKKKTSLWSVLVVVLFVSALFAVVSCKSRKEPEVVKEQAKVAGELQDAAAGTYNEPVKEVSKNDTVNFVAVSVMPTFNGKDVNEFTRWVSKNIVYPPVAKEKGIKGRVILNFVINKEGKVTNVKVLKSANSLLDKEAVRVVSSSPAWTPGYQDGKVVNVNFTFPVIFFLK